MQQQGTTTKAASDLYLELKDIKLEINKAKAEKESVLIELKQHQEALAAVEQEYSHGVDVHALRDTVLSNIKAGLQKDIDSLSNRKDSLDQAVNVFKSDLKDLTEKNKKITFDIEEKAIEMLKMTSELENIKNTKKEEIKSLTSEIEKNTKALIEIKKSNEAELKIINDARVELDNAKKLRMKEDIRLANKGSDLHIYEARLRKKYLELMPGVEIVV